MTAGIATFIVVMTAMVLVAGLFGTWINARNRGREQDPDELGAERQVELLASENAALKGQVGRLEERLAVLERIATDPAERTAHEIEKLR